LVSKENPYLNILNPSLYDLRFQCSYPVFIKYLHINVSLERISSFESIPLSFVPLLPEWPDGSTMARLLLTLLGLHVSSTKT